MTSHVTGTHGALLLAAALLVPRPAATAQSVTWSTSAGASTGRYFFSERVTTYSILTGLDVRQGRLSLSATLPVVGQNSTVLTFLNGTPVPTGGPDAAVVRARQSGRQIPMTGGRRNRGGSASLAATAAEDSVLPTTGPLAWNVGDPFARGSIDLIAGDGTLRALSLHGMAKAPVASVESGVGTGAWDVGAGLGVSLASERMIFMADATYWTLGDMPDLELEDNVAYGVSVGGTSSGGAWSVLASLNGATRIVPTADPPLSAGLTIARMWSGGHMVSIGGSAGLTESTADAAVYLGVGLRLSR